MNLYKTRQSRRYDEIHLTRQFFEASGPHSHFFDKKILMGNVCTNFRSLTFFVGSGSQSQTNKFRTNQQTNMEISSCTSCVPHVDLTSWLTSHVYICYAIFWRRKKRNIGNENQSKHHLGMNRSVLCKVGLINTFYYSRPSL